MRSAERRRRVRRAASAAAAVAALIGLLPGLGGSAGAAGGDGGSPPQYETDFVAHNPNGESCGNPRYPECRRLRFYSAPMTVPPGNNQATFGPMTIEKPAYDGYLVRSKPDLVYADGSVPKVDVVHLHHGVVASYPEYGSSPQFGGTGEEKTIANFPPGYGLPVKGSDVWYAVLMLHDTGTAPQTVQLYNELDYVPKAAAERRGIKRVVPIWLDVKRGTERNNYPVFNVQRSFGKPNPKTGRRECTYPRDACAAFDPWGEPQPGIGKGWDYVVPPSEAGTLVLTAGHVHPGGLRTELSVVRKIDGREVERKIFVSEAKYFDPNGPVSWDMAMTATPRDWRVKVRPGDRLRLNGVYETERADWYEGMAIMVAAVAPGDESGIDPFEKVKVRPKPRRRGAGRSRPRYRYRQIPLYGEVTHGHLAENEHYGGENQRPLPGKEGPLSDGITIANFAYLPGDLSTAARDGIPRVRAGRKLTVWNADSPTGLLHTLTTCRQPCTGVAGISYPLADDATAVDSLELGYSLNFSPGANTSTYAFVPRAQGMKPGETYTYFCRVHPFMRGAFKVVE